MPCLLNMLGRWATNIIEVSPGEIVVAGEKSKKYQHVHWALNVNLLKLSFTLNYLYEIRNYCRNACSTF